MVKVEANSIVIGGGRTYHCVVMSEFLTALAGGRQIMALSHQLLRNLLCGTAAGCTCLAAGLAVVCLGVLDRSVCDAFCNPHAGKIKGNNAAMKNYKRMYLPPPQVRPMQLTT